MKTSFLTFVTMAAVCFSACKTNNTVADGAHNSRNSLDWAGIYRGSVALADKKEQLTVISLESDLTYRLQSAVTDEYDKATDTKGTFEWSKSGGDITLKDANGKSVVYQVGERRLVNKQTKEVLTQLKKEGITEKYWKLVEINGQPVSAEGMNREPFIILKDDETKSVSGNGGCNGFFGSYELNDQTSRIKFSKMGSTMMACLNMEVESAFHKVLQEVDNYSISADGTKLSLNKARMAPLARFEVVYLR